MSDHQEDCEISDEISDDIPDEIVESDRNQNNKRPRTDSPEISRYPKLEIVRLHRLIEQERLLKVKLVNQLNLKINELKNENRQLSTNLQYVASKEESANEERQSYKQMLEVEKENYSRTNSAAEKKILELQEQINDLATRDPKVGRLQEDFVSQMSDRAKNAESLAQSLQSDLNNVKNELKMTQSELRDTQLTIKKFQESGNFLEVQNDNERKAKEKLYRQRIRDLEKLVSRVKLKLHEKEIECQNVESYSTELVELREKVKNLELDLTRLEADKAEHQALLEEYREWQNMFTKLTQNSGIDTSPFHILRMLQKLQQNHASLLLKSNELEGRLSHTSEKLRIEHKKLMSETSNVSKLKTSLLETETALKIERATHEIHMREIDNLKEVLKSCLVDPDKNVEEAMKKIENIGISGHQELSNLRKSIDSESIPNESAKLLHTRINELEVQLSSAISERDNALKALEKNEHEHAKFEQRTAIGDFDKTVTKVLHLAQNPNSMAASRKMQETFQRELEDLKRKNEQLTNQIQALTEGSRNAIDSSVISVSASQGLDSDTRYERLKQIYGQKSKFFREAIYLLLGFKVDLNTEREFPIIKLRSMYAENDDDVLVFQWVNGKPELLSNEFAATLDRKVYTYLQMCHSIPSFLASVILEQFEQRTFQVAT